MELKCRCRSPQVSMFSCCWSVFILFSTLYRCMPAYQILNVRRPFKIAVHRDIGCFARWLGFLTRLLVFDSSRFGENFFFQENICNIRMQYLF